MSKRSVYKPRSYISPPKSGTNIHISSWAYIRVVTVRCVEYEDWFYSEKYFLKIDDKIWNTTTKYFLKIRSFRQIRRRSCIQIRWQYKETKSTKGFVRNICHLLPQYQPPFGEHKWNPQSHHLLPGRCRHKTSPRTLNKRCSTYYSGPDHTPQLRDATFSRIPWSGKWLDPKPKPKNKV